MIKTTLKQRLEENGCLEKGLLVYSLLIKEIEVCGFLNGVKDFGQTDGKFLHLYNSILNKAPHRMLVRSGMVHQIFEYFDGSKISSMNCVFRIYTTLTVNESDFEMDLKDIHVPALEKSSIYRDIKQGFKCFITDDKLRKNGFPEFIKVKEDKVVCEIAPGKILCLNKDGEIRSLGEDIQVLCRYLHPETGIMCYTIYSMDELFI